MAKRTEPLPQVKGFFRLFNGYFDDKGRPQVITNRLGGGWRHVYVEVGRKWVRVVEWATGDRIKISRALWEAAQAEPCPPPRRYVIHMCSQMARTVSRDSKLLRRAEDSTRRRA